MLSSPGFLNQVPVPAVLLSRAALLTALKPHRPIPVHLFRSATTICPAGVEILFHCARQALRSRCLGESPSNVHPVVIVLPEPAAAAVVAAVAPVDEVEDKRRWFTRRAERAPGKPFFSWATCDITEVAALP